MRHIVFCFLFFWHLTPKPSAFFLAKQFWCLNLNQTVCENQSKQWLKVKLKNGSRCESESRLLVKSWFLFVHTDFFFTSPLHWEGYGMIYRSHIHTFLCESCGLGAPQPPAGSKNSTSSHSNHIQTLSVWIFFSLIFLFYHLSPNTMTVSSFFTLLDFIQTLL